MTVEKNFRTYRDYERAYREGGTGREVEDQVTNIPIPFPVNFALLHCFLTVFVTLLFTFTLHFYPVITFFGVQAHIREISPLAIYTHCSGHCLNLVITSCSLPMITNVLDKMQATCLFFLNSPMQNRLLSKTVSKNVTASRRKPLIDLCKTRWAERHSANEHFHQAYNFLVITLEAIALGFHRDDPSDNYSQWRI